MRSKKWIILLTMAAMLSAAGCVDNEENNQLGNQPKETIPAPGDDMEGNEELGEEQNGKKSVDGIVAELEQIANKAQEASELTAYMDEYMPKVDPAGADRMLTVLEEYYEKDFERVSDEFFAPGVQEAFAATGYAEADKVVSLLKDEKVKQLVQRKLAGKYMLVTTEGVYYPMVNYLALSEEYGPYLSEELRMYLQVRALEAIKITTADAAIRITWDELASRVLMTEQYLAQYPQGQRKDDLRELYQYYLSLYIMGSDNTPVYNWEDYKVKEEAWNSYQQLVELMPDSIAASLVHEYMRILQTTDLQVRQPEGDYGTDIPEVQKFHEELYSRIEALLTSGDA